MIPATSNERSAPLTARKLPTASICGCHSSMVAAEAEMVCGGDPMEDMNFLIMVFLKA